MKQPSIGELQKHLSTLPPKKIVEITTRLAKHKKEIKELLTYLLFEADDEEAYISKIKEEVDSQFAEMNSSNLYLAKKTLRKILRIVNKNIRFSGQPATELELRIYYCKKLRESGIHFMKSQVLVNLYSNQINKIQSTLLKLHEDLQYDFQKEIDQITLK